MRRTPSSSSTSPARASSPILSGCSPERVRADRGNPQMGRIRLRQDGGVTSLHDLLSRGFASDNYSGIHPEILDAIVRANGAHQIAYGDDVYTAELQRVFRRHFGEDAQAFPV